MEERSLEFLEATKYVDKQELIKSLYIGRLVEILEHRRSNLEEEKKKNTEILAYLLRDLLREMQENGYIYKPLIEK